MIVLGNFKDFKPADYDEVWIIMRSVKDKSMFRKYNNVYHHPELSPSPALFSWYLGQRDAGLWDHDVFVSYYVPEFLKQISHDPAARNALNWLYTEARIDHKKILLLCACQDEEICHRSVVGGIEQGAGVDVMSTTIPHFSKTYYYNGYQFYRLDEKSSR